MSSGKWVIRIKNMLSQSSIQAKRIKKTHAGGMQRGKEWILLAENEEEGKAWIRMLKKASSDSRLPRKTNKIELNEEGISKYRYNGHL